MLHITRGNVSYIRDILRIVLYIILATKDRHICKYYVSVILNLVPGEAIIIIQRY